MTIEKLTVTPEIAEAIEHVKQTFNLNAFVKFADGGQASHPIARRLIGEFGKDELLQVVFYGYEVEKSPEEKVREYYEISRMWVEDRGNVNTPSVKYKLGTLDGIKGTLDLLGIQIEGVNA